MSHRVLLPTRPTIWHHVIPKAAGAFDYPVAPVGMVGHASVYYDTGLGASGLLLAQQVYHLLPQAIVKCELDFGRAVLGFNVIVAGLEAMHDGSGGAYHYGCDFTTGRTLYVDAAFGNPLMTLGLVVAELTECQMGLQNAGWNCGGSNGEALSRFLAELMSGGPLGELVAYSTGPAWDKAGRPNWINTTEGSDRNPISIGCGVVYLYWLLSQGVTVPRIVQAGGITLSDHYDNLGLSPAQGTAWQAFLAACARFPMGAITSDDPWSSPA